MPTIENSGESSERERLIALWREVKDSLRDLLRKDWLSSSDRLAIDRLLAAAHESTEDTYV